jgi:hypothetical protein
VILSPAIVTQLLVIGWITWVFAALVQVLDLANSLVDRRDARDRRALSRGARARFREFVWTVSFGAGLAALVAFGVDWSARLVFDQGNLPLGLMVLTWSIVAAVLGGVVIVAQMLRPEVPTYASIRTDIEDALEQRLTDEQIDEFRRLVAVVDKRVGYLRTYPNLSATAFLWRRTQLRLAPMLIPVLLGLYLFVAARPTPDAVWVVGTIMLVPAAISYGLAWAAARASLASKRAWHEVYAGQRAEVEQLLAGARKSSKKRVAGLGDRVTRALQILREQQN